MEGHWLGLLGGEGTKLAATWWTAHLNMQNTRFMHSLGLQINFFMVYLFYQVFIYFVVKKTAVYRNQITAIWALLYCI